MTVRRLINETERKNRELIKIHKDHMASAIEKIAGVCGLSEAQEKALKFYLTKS